MAGGSSSDGLAAFFLDADDATATDAPMSEAVLGAVSLLAAAVAAHLGAGSSGCAGASA